MLISQNMRMTSVVRQMIKDILRGPTYPDLNKQVSIYNYPFSCASISHIIENSFAYLETILPI